MTIRVLVFVTPIVLSFVVALALSRSIDVPVGFWARVGRWIMIAVIATAAMMAAQRFLRRLLPLAALFSLTLVFPDETPSRFGIALRGMSARHLERRMEAVERDGLGETPAEAAETLLELVAALSRHDRLTRGHSERVRAYAVMIGEEMDLSAEDLDALRWAGLLHDVGKLRVPTEILNKPGTLTDAEFAVVREHPGAGKAMVAPLADWLGPSAAAVYEHHERWEGGGYPTGVPSERLSMSSRIVSVADAFDVMTSARSYKSMVSANEARSELQRCAGTQFDPTVVRAMMNISLGRLWRAMGPMSWVAQLGLFPRSVAQAGPAGNAAIAALVSLVLTGLASRASSTQEDVMARVAVADDGALIADGDSLSDSIDRSGGDTPTGDAADGDAAVGDAGAPSGDSPSQSDSAEPRPSPPSPSVLSLPDAVAQLPPILTTPPATTVRPTTGTTSTISVVVPALTTTTVSATGSPSTVSTTTPGASATTVASTTTATTTSIGTVPTTTTTAAATTTITTTTTTTTTPPTSSIFVLASVGAGDRPSVELLALELERPPANSVLPNYDTDRNDDPGLTIVASPNGLVTGDPASVQAWRLPASVTEIDGPAILTLWLAPSGPQQPGLLLARVGLFDCNATRTECVPLVRDTVTHMTATRAFTPVEFDLTIGSVHVVGPGRTVELRFATLNGSSNDIWVGYDATATPSMLDLTG